ncbi:MAG: DNA ligase, partial [Candidatus Heimdallarchaeota archaeon]|nr:DNA ligase [Candidatus Heimdallarchaeota archaeon]
MKFKELSQCYFKLEKTQKKLEMVDILADVIKESDAKEIGKIALLTLGKLYPDFIGIELMLAERMAIKSLAIATGKSEKSVQSLLDEIGDLGKTAHQLLEKKPQSTLLAFTKQEELQELNVLDIWEIFDS